MSLRFLLVDDEPLSLRVYRRAIQKNIRPTGNLRGGQDILPMEMVEAETVSFALNCLQNQKFDIIVVDMMMPGSQGERWGGLEIIETAVRLDPLRPVIAITGYGNMELARKAWTQGVCDFIEKSDKTDEELVEAIQKALDRFEDKLRWAGNPFTPRTSDEPTFFGGRRKELEFFEEKLLVARETGRFDHFLVLGDWGIGKSTLLKEYKKFCQNRGYMASIVTLEALQPGTKVGEAVRSVVEGIVRDLPYPVEQFKHLVAYSDEIEH